MGFLFLSYWLLEEIIRFDRVLKIDVIYCKHKRRNSFGCLIDKLENSLYQQTEFLVKRSNILAPQLYRKIWTLIKFAGYLIESQFFFMILTDGAKIFRNF